MGTGRYGRRPGLVVRHLPGTGAHHRAGGIRLLRSGDVGADPSDDRAVLRLRRRHRATRADRRCVPRYRVLVRPGAGRGPDVHRPGDRATDRRSVLCADHRADASCPHHALHPAGAGDRADGALPPGSEHARPRCPDPARLRHGRVRRHRPGIARLWRLGPGDGAGGAIRRDPAGDVLAFSLASRPACASHVAARTAVFRRSFHVRQWPEAILRPDQPALRRPVRRRRRCWLVTPWRCA